MSPLEEVYVTSFTEKGDQLSQWRAERSGRYGKRAKEVAARTVMKQHKEKGHRNGE